MRTYLRTAMRIVRQMPYTAIVVTGSIILTLPESISRDGIIMGTTMSIVFSVCFMSWIGILGDAS